VEKISLIQFQQFEKKRMPIFNVRALTLALLVGAVLNEILSDRKQISSSWGLSATATVKNGSGAGTEAEAVVGTNTTISIMCDRKDSTLSYCRSVNTTESFCRCMAHYGSFVSSESSQRNTPYYPTLSSSMWHRHEPTIRRSALNSLSHCWKSLNGLNETAFDESTKALFTALTPFRLGKSLKTPANPLVWEKVLQVILRRQQDPSHNPPLMIAVFGGSVTEGVRSHNNNVGLPKKDLFISTSCAWPHKLQLLMNDMLGEDAVLIKNYAVAGTDSGVAHSVIAHDLWPDKQYQPEQFDIIISAFSTNDGQAPVSVRAEVFRAMQAFVKACQDLRPCSDLPLVVQLEDNPLDTLREDSNMMEGLHFNRDMVQTSNWANIMSISYADAIRDFVYTHDVTDTTVTHYNEVHPGLSFHTGMSWILGWNFMNGVATACDAPLMPEYDNPEPRVGSSLPFLDATSTSRDILEAHRNITALQTTSTACQNGNNSSKTKCIYKWVASLLASKTRHDVQQAVSSVATEIKGWKGFGEVWRPPRRTWLGEGLNSTFTIQLNNLDTPITNFLLMVSLVCTDLLCICISWSMVLTVVLPVVSEKLWTNVGGFPVGNCDFCIECGEWQLFFLARNPSIFPIRYTQCYDKYQLH
jgi:hypothetical protein